MGDVEDVWRRKSEQQLVDAFRCIEEYGVDGQRAIRAEFSRRGLPEPSKKPITLGEVEAVARLHRRFAFLVGAQWSSLIGFLFWQVPGNSTESILAILCGTTLLLTFIAVPMTGYKLLNALGVESPRGTAVLMRMPLFGLLMVLGMRSFNAQWSREYGVEVGLLGPTDECLQRLRERQLRIPRS